MPRAAAPFYHQHIKNMIATFGIIFRDIAYVDDFGNVKVVPIHYAPKEKFVEMVRAHKTHDDGYEFSIELPRFGFELADFTFDPSRNLNPMSMVRSCQTDSEWSYNRVPYNFDFTLYLATRRFETGLKIVEQIVPFFAPELNVSMKEHEHFGITTDVPFTLTGVNHEIDYLGTFESARTIVWTLSIEAKGYLYSDIKAQGRIKETITKMGNVDFNQIYETLTSEVDPRTAEQADPHEIVEDVIPGDVEVLDSSFRAITGETASVDLQQGEQPLHVREIITGEGIELVEMFD